MKLLREYHQIASGKDRPHIYISGDGDDDSDSVVLRFVRDDVEAAAYLNRQSLRLLRDLIDGMLDDHDTTARCGACGYTLADAQVHGDHKLCRNYPFFQWERELPQSEAVDR